MKLTTDAAAHAPFHDADLHRHIFHIILRLYHLQHVLKSDHVDLRLQQIWHEPTNIATYEFLADTDMNMGKIKNRKLGNTQHILLLRGAISSATMSAIILLQCRLEQGRR